MLLTITIVLLATAALTRSSAWASVGILTYLLSLGVALLGRGLQFAASYVPSLEAWGTVMTAHTSGAFGLPSWLSFVFGAVLLMAVMIVTGESDAKADAERTESTAETEESRSSSDEDHASSTPGYSPPESDGSQRRIDGDGHTDASHELIAELRELNENWSQIDRKLLYSVGDAHPDDYVEAFGSLDAALVAAGIADSSDVDAEIESADPADADQSDEDGATGVSESDASGESEGKPSEERTRRSENDVHRPETGSSSGHQVATTAEPTKSDQSAEQSADDGRTGGEQSDLRREELLAELEALRENWSQIDRKLLYSVSDHHPDEYDEEFGGLDTALELVTGSDESSSRSHSREPAGNDDTTSGPDAASTDGIPPNELAELYSAFDRFRRLLDAVADSQTGDGTTPLSRWSEAVTDRWGGSGPAQAPNYGAQQRDRNDFTISDYRDVYGDGDRITEFHHVAFSVVPGRIRDRVDESFETGDQIVPIAPDSTSPLPIAVDSTAELNEAVSLLEEFPAYPSADRSAPDEADTGASVALPEGRIDELTVTIRGHDPSPGSKRDARLRVELDDGTKMPLDIWTTHDVDVEWAVGATYTLEQPRHKVWDSEAGRQHELSSSSDLRVVETGSDSATESRSGIDDVASGDWDAAETTRDGGTPDRTALITAIEQVARATDSPLKATEFADRTEYTVHDVTRVFGSWQNALEAADIDNEARLVAELRRVAEELGRQPTTTEMNAHGSVSATTYANYFGTYSAATERAFGETGVARATSPAATGGGEQSDERDVSESETADTEEEILDEIIEEFEEFSGST